MSFALFINVLFLILPWPYVCLFILHDRINSATRRSNSPQFSRLLNFQTFNHGLNHSKIHTARQFCECLLFLFRQSSMVKPV